MPMIKLTTEEILDLEEAKLLENYRWQETNSCKDLNCLGYKTIHDSQFKKMVEFARKRYGVNAQEWINENTKI